MHISIFGMGYVGVVSAACLLRDGHTICGVDPIASKVEDLSKGLTPLQEPGVAELLAAGHAEGRLSATTDPARAVEQADMIWICVGTPSSLMHGIDLTHVRAVMAQIGQALAKCPARPLIVLRSTVLPGVTEQIMAPILEKNSGLKIGQDLDLVFHPEFLRESTAVADFDRPPKIVVGQARPEAAARLLKIYEGYAAPRFLLTPGEAEMVKYADNLFHALKITFANEIASLAHSAKVDARKVSETFCADTKLNISPRYLRPGFAYGGSCLPKDLRAILRFATLQGIPTPLLSATLQSNKMQIERFIERILTLRPSRVGMVGLAFKPDTDDMRESPYVAVAKALLGEGVTVRIHDPSVNVERLIGSNRKAVEKALGHLCELMVPSLDELDDMDLILINHARVDRARIEQWTGKGIPVIDLADTVPANQFAKPYEGIYW